MSTFAGTLRQALGEYSPGDQDEINIKVKPLAQTAASTGESALGSNPQLPSAQASASGGLAGGEVSSAGGQQQLSLGAPQGLAAAQGLVPGLTNKPLQLDTAAPLGSQTDSIYEAAAAQLAQAAQQRNLEILQQLGYVDQTSGQLIPGTLETEAIRQRYELNRQIEEAKRSVDEGASRGGTVFSGRRAQLQGLQTEPLFQQLANVDVDLARAVSEALMGINNTQSQFGVDRNLLIAEAAERARQRALQQQAMAPPPAPAGPPPSAGGAPPPAPPPMAAPPASLPQGYTDLSWLDPAIRAAMQARGSGMYV